MNKKFTFMVAALLAAGGFSANALEANDLGVYSKALKNGMKVYLGDGTSFLKAVDNIDLKGDDPVVSTFVTKTVTDLEKAALFEISDYEPMTATTAKFKLKYQDKYVYVLNSDGTPATEDKGLTDVTSEFQITISEGNVNSSEPNIKYILKSTGDASDYDFNIAADGDDYDFSTTAGLSVKMYTEKEIEYTSEENVESKLNAHLGGKGFSLEYKLKEGEKLENTNIFSKEVRAFNIEADGWNTSSLVDAGIYFATKYPEGGIKSEADFKASTFIVVNPNKNIGSDEAADGVGFELTEVKGSNIVKSNNDGIADGATYTGKISSNNARFTVVENDPTNAAGKLSVSLEETTFSYVKDGKYATTTSSPVNVGIYKSDLGKFYFVTLGSDKSVYAAEFASSSIATAEDLLKEEGPAVYTIKFTSGKDAVTSDDGSEYDKYLYSTSKDGSNWIFAAEGTKYVDIKNPAAQWTISDYDSEENVFTFRNRLTEQTIALSLNKLGNGEYTVMSAKNSVNTDAQFAYGYIDAAEGYKLSSATDVKSTTVKLTAATVDKTAGFATIEDEKLNDVVTVKFNIPETPTSTGAFYVTSKDGATAVADKAVSGVIDGTKATKFQLVKFDAAASDSEVVISDTVYVDNGFKYWDAEKEEVKESLSGDTLAYVTYAFKQVTNDGNDWYLNNNAETVTKHTAGNEIPKFVLKENLNGTYALIPANGDDEYDNTAVGQTFVSVDNAGALDFEEKLYDSENAANDFVIEFGEPTPSLKAESKHVAFNTSLGYVAMNENAEGIVAPVSSLKAEYSKEDLTFWLDTADSKAVTPSFLISKAGKFLYNTADSAKYYDSESATVIENNDFKLPNGDLKAMFQTATLKDSETITVNGKDYTAADGLNNFKFQIVQNTEDSEGEYVIRSLRDYSYLSNSNGKLGFTGSKANAMVVSVETMEAPTSNESVSASEVAVVAQNGSVVVKNAAGKNVVVSTILGQVVANEVLTSDNATINVPAGIVVVAVEGESFKVNVK